MFADDVQQGSGAIFMSADVHQEGDAPLEARTSLSKQSSRPAPSPHGPAPKKKKVSSTEELIGVGKGDDVEEDRNTF